MLYQKIVIFKTLVEQIAKMALKTVLCSGIVNFAWNRKKKVSHDLLAYLKMVVDDFRSFYRLNGYTSECIRTHLLFVQTQMQQ